MDRVEEFQERGYAYFPALLAAEAVHYRLRMQQITGLSDADYPRIAAIADGVSKHPEFWDIIFHPLLLAAARQALGLDIRYLQHSDLHVHRSVRPGSETSWHRDNAHRQFGIGPDWDESNEPYQMARVAIYLQTFEESGSCLGLKPGSHRSSASEELFIPTNPGDVLFFDPRLLHTATPLRGPKYAIFLSYGVPNEHSRNHRRFYLHTRTDLAYSPFAPELEQRLRDAQLLLEV